MALSQINDPRYNREVSCYRGLSNFQETLEVMMEDTQGWVVDVMKELMTSKDSWTTVKRGWRLAMHMRNWTTISTLPIQSLYTPATHQFNPLLLTHPESSELLPCSHHAPGDQWRCLSSKMLTLPAATSLGPTDAGSRAHGVSVPKEEEQEMHHMWQYP